MRLLVVTLALGSVLSAAACSSDGGTSDGTAGAPSGAGTAGNGAGGSSAGSTVGGSAGTTSGGASGVGGSAAGSGGTSGAAGAGGAGGGGGSGSGCVLSATDEAQPMLLSQTGCINMADPAKPAPGLVPYSVRSALWSDGAKKERFMRVPDGLKIHVLDCAVELDLCKDPGMGGNGEDDGHFDFPVGTVLVKNFSIDSKHIETRLLMRRSMTVWKGFSYEWNDAQTDATLLADDETGKDKPLAGGTQTWHYPSRSQCLQCHTKYAGRSLGPSTAQLNSDFAYADGSMNQIEKLKALGLFDAPPKQIVGYPDPAAADSIDVRARSYIHANCAICHRPGGEYSSVDMRFGTPLDMTHLCEKSERAAGMVPAYRLFPTDPSKSSMSSRVHTLDSMLRMPKIGSLVVDPDGSKLIDDWITSLPANACPPQP